MLSIRLFPVALAIGLAVATPASAQFIRGDVNDDGTTDIADVIGTLSYLFVAGTPAPACLDALDNDDNGIIDIADPVQLAGYLFSFGPPPAPPFPDPGADPTPDGLGDCGGAGVGTPLPFTVLESGDYSGVPAPCEIELLTFAIREQVEWELFWSLHVTIMPAPPLPPVDFASENLIVVMQSASSSGWSVDVGSVVEYPDHVEVDVTVEDPAGCFTLFVCAAPYQVLVVPVLGTSGDVTANVTTEFPCL